MSKKLIGKILAALLASVSVFAFSACNTDEGETGTGTGTGTENSGSVDNGTTDDNTGGNDDFVDAGDDFGGDDEDDGNDNGDEDGDIDIDINDKFDKVDPPVITNVPVAEAVKITKSLGSQETCYVEWNAAKDAEWYEVYVKPDGGTFTKIDDELVRLYENTYRADAVGLKAGKYSMKVVPVFADGTNESLSATASDITVVAHERTGFAFVDGTSSGAYNEDGTLKSDAKVIYVTNKNKDTVTATLNTGKKDETFTGLQNILNALKKVSAPVNIRLVGKIYSPAIDGKNNKNPNTVLVKECKSGVTLEGIGADATAFGWTLRLVSVDNVEVRNIGFMNTQASEPDDMTLEKDTHVWVHNCDFFYGGAGGDSDQAKGDGALDTKTSTNITHSYNHFWDTGKSNLQNMKEKSGPYLITYHHNWYDHSDSRHPRIRTATVHVYNNYFDGNAKYCVGVTLGASAFVENNYFRSTATMKPMLSSMQGTDALGEGTFSKETGGMIKAFGNYFDGKYALITQNDTADKTNLDCYLASSRTETVPSDYKTKSGGTSYNNFDTSSDMYKYTVDTPEVAKQKVEAYAGRVDGGDMKYVFDNAAEDANYSIIAELKAMTQNYTSKLARVGKENI